MVQALCKSYSPPLLSLADPGVLPADTSTSSTEQPEIRAYHPVPPPSVLAAPEVSAALRNLGFGYRAEFIQRTAEMLVNSHGEAPEKWLRTLRDKPTPDARDELLKFVGVGRKVADCVLLMSLDKVGISHWTQSH